MKLTELVKVLNEIQAVHGDVEVLLNNETAPQDVAGDTDKFFVVPEPYKNDAGRVEQIVSLRAWPY